MSGTILVTGAHGAIGSYATRELVGRGWTVVRFDIAPTPVTPHPELAGQPLVVGDVRDTELVARTIREAGATRVLHLAALVNIDHDPATAIEVNALATARLLDAAAAAGLERVIAMSTKGTLGPLEPRYVHPVYDPVPVDHPTRPETPYEASKLLVEVAVTTHRRRGAPFAAARLSTTWGPGKSGATHGGFSLHSDVVSAALRGESSTLSLHPDQGHDLVYYADVARGLADLVAGDGELRRLVYHVGAGRITRLGEFAAAVEAAFPGVAVTLGERFPGGRSCLMDIGPAREDAGYVPAWPVARALDEIKALAAAGIIGA